MMRMQISPEAEVMKDIILDIGEHKPFVLVEAVCSIAIDYMELLMEEYVENTGGLPADEHDIRLKIFGRSK